MEWNEKTKLWTVKSEKGQTYVANFVVSAPGPLHKPSIPKFKGKLFRFLFMSCLCKNIVISKDAKGHLTAVIYVCRC